MNTVHYSTELESQVLCHLMSIGNHDCPRVQKAMLLLTEKSFHNVMNAKLFVMIKNCFKVEQAFTFVDILVNIGQGSPELHEHLNLMTDAYHQFHMNNDHLERDLEKLKVIEINRGKVFLLEATLREVNNCTNPLEVPEIIHQKLMQIANEDYGDRCEAIDSEDLIDAILSGKTESKRIIPTRSMQFNSLLGGGLRSKGLITVAGAAGVGKTGFAIWLMDIIAKNQPSRQNIFFSLEMDPQDIMERQIGLCAGTQFDKLSPEELTEGSASAIGVSLKLFDNKCSDLDRIITMSKLLAAQRPLSVIVVDYLTLVVNRGSFERNDLRQADTTSKLAKLAHELDCIVIALSQVNRGAATRDDQCPMPHDAADSSGSHRSSMLWLGIDRPQLYNDDPCYQDQFVIKCRKNRYGGNFEYALSFNDGAFQEVSPGHFRKPEKKSKADPSMIYDTPYKPHHSY